MAITVGDKTYRNLPEQVEENANNIEFLLDTISSFGNVMRYCGSVATYADLPTEDVNVGDVYNVLDTGTNYAWDGEAWDELSSVVDLSGYVTKISCALPYYELTGSEVFADFIEENNLQSKAFISKLSSYSFLCLASTSSTHLTFRLIDIYNFVYYSGYVLKSDNLTFNGMIQDTYRYIPVLDKGNQTIGGTKTFEGSMPIKIINTSSQPLANQIGFYNDGSLNICNFNNQGNPTDILVINQGGLACGSNKDLGSNGRKWRDLYLSRNLTDGTNSISIADIANSTINVINASDIVSNTLTQAQLDLITNGKPTYISGEILNINNGLLFLTGPIGADGYYGLFVGERSSTKYFRAKYIRINTSRVIQDSSDKNIEIQNIKSINQLELPSNPSSTGTFQFECVNGTLSWTQKAHLYKHEIVGMTSYQEPIYVINNDSTGTFTNVEHMLLDALNCYAYEQQGVLQIIRIDGNTIYFANGTNVTLTSAEWSTKVVTTTTYM